MKLLILTKYDSLGASSRMRALQYIPWFEQAGIEVQALPLYNNLDLDRRYKQGAYGGLTIARRFASRIRSLFSNQADVIWVEKELLQWMPAWFEKWLLDRPYLMDFDDAVFHGYDEHRWKLVRALYGQKFDRLMHHAALVIAGNEYLADRARSAGSRWIEIVPTVIDLDRYVISPADAPTTDNQVVVGWIGSPYNTRYLPMVERPLARVSQEHNLRFRVIGARPVRFEGIEIEQLDWSAAEEVNLLAGCDIGIMPLPDEPWERGKCGYKLIQYMACGKPVVASPVGVNTSIVTPDIGFLCQNETDWYDAFSKLASDPGLRSQMGRAGRRTVEQAYCIQVTAPRIISYLRQIGGQNVAGPTPKDSKTEFADRAVVESASK